MTCLARARKGGGFTASGCVVERGSLALAGISPANASAPSPMPERVNNWRRESAAGGIHARSARGIGWSIDINKLVGHEQCLSQGRPGVISAGSLSGLLFVFEKGKCAFGF